MNEHVFFYRSFNSVGKRSLPSLTGRFTLHPSLDILIHPLDAAARTKHCNYIHLPFTTIANQRKYLLPAALYLTAVSSEN